MHLVTFRRELDMGNAGLFPAGTVLMEDRNTAEIMLMFEGQGITAEHFESAMVGANNSVLIAGSLGFGDAIMLTPVLRALHEQGLQVYVSTPPHYRAALLNLPYIAGFENWPLKPETLENYGRVQFLEGFQHHALSRTKHMSDVFAAICGVTVADYKADYFVTEDERQWAATEFPRYEGRKRIGIQVQASHRCRSYHGAQLRKVMELLIKDGWELYMMGRPGEFGCQETGHIHDLTKYAPMFRQSAAFLTTCDAFLGPDSGFLHVAGAMGIPSVGLFSVFPWQLRTAHYPRTFSIQAVGDCGPCFHGPNRLQSPFPAQHCMMAGHCTILAAIEPERVLARVKQVSEQP